MTNSTQPCHSVVWRAHKNELRSFLVARCTSAAEADDLLQEVFVRALLQGRDFCCVENPRAWLFHVARNLLIDRLRVTREQVELPDDLRDESDDETPAVDVLSHCLPRVLSELPTRDREAILLCDLQGMTQQDYARHIGLGLPAAKSRVQRARRRLHVQLVASCQVRFDDAGKVCCFTPRPALTDEKPPDETHEPGVARDRSDSRA